MDKLGAIDVGAYTIVSAKPGESVILPVPVKYTRGKMHYYSNLGAGKNKGKQIMYIDGNTADDYNQDITEALSYVSMEISQAQFNQDDFPLQAGSKAAAFELITEEIIDGESVTINYGYAVFSDLKVKSGAQNGTYNVFLDIEFCELADGRESDVYKEQIIINITITGAKTSGGGGGGYIGGGGGGGGGGSEQLTQAKLIVKSISTDPMNIRAGDEFDLLITLLNTNEKQLVQNIKVTVTATDDMILPVSGSSATYIDKIEAGGEYDLAMRVKAALNAPDTPIKLDVSMEYEDKSLSAQSASETLTMRISPVFRVRLEDPKPSNPGEIPIENSSYTLKTQVVNEGRNTIYNTKITAECEDENLVLPAPYFIGDMEGGSAKTVEMEFFPMAAGDYAVSMLLTYENTSGEQVSDPGDVRTHAFYVLEEETYEDDPYLAFPEQPTPEPQVDSLALMRLLPWWIYAALGGLILLMIIAIGSGARNRRRRALEYDEIE
jgi:hypothetical protein